MDVSQRDVRSMLDELFGLRTGLASLQQERDAAILRQLPPELQETVASIMQEFADMQEQREQEDTALAGQIRTAVKTLGEPVLGTHLQASYDPGRRSWDSDGLERLAEREPEVLTYRRQGEPVVSIRARAQRRRMTPVLYDMHGL
jgi:hypothetical protein